jgi:dephospho-CoA kinase
VNHVSKIPLIGIVGGIASGKSTVAAEFERLGCARIDADAIAHELLDDPDVLDKIVRRFGPDILDAQGHIQRNELGKRAFSSRENLDALTAIMHPTVMQRIEGLIARYRDNAVVPAIVLDVPLLFEVGWAERCDRVVFVNCLWPRRIERVRLKGKLTEDDVKIREKFQISLDTKEALADNSIDNNSDFSALVRQIQEIFSDMTKKT